VRSRSKERVLASLGAIVATIEEKRLGPSTGSIEFESEIVGSYWSQRRRLWDLSTT